MRLKTIKLAGFKSFVDPTTISIPSRLIGIVGPNGCGKSNIIDAVRWVMGESSAKYLRGDALADVIFNGSSSRKPVGQASIELVFDNSEGRLGGQYAGYNDIAVKRELSRDGQSTYYLNGSRCRRRDISDIFLGTGLGPRSYAIIEQGTISRLVEAKPEELRLFLEEAAGISKYKERRRETENRLRHTRENLDRINDIVGELQRRLDYLQRQSQTAEKFKQLKQEERLLRGQLLSLRWQALDRRVQGQERGIQAEETRVEQQNADLRRIETTVERRREELREGTEQFNRVQGQFYSVGADIARSEQSIQHQKELRAQQQQDLAQLERDLQDLQGHLEQDRRQVDALGERLQTREPSLTEARRAEAGSAEALGAAEAALAEWQQQWDQLHADTSEHARSAEVERTRLEHREQQLQQLDQRLQRLHEQQSSLELEGMRGDIERLRREVETDDDQVNEMRRRLQAHIDEITRGRERAAALARRVEDGRERLHAAQRRLTSLEARQQAALGEGHAAATPWLERHHLEHAERLVNKLDVDDGWERAVETVLGFHLEAICVEDSGALVADLAGLEQGAVSLFDVGRTPVESAPAGYETLAGKVRSPWRLEPLLENVYAAQDLQDALRRRAQLQGNQSVITREGMWLGRNWVRVTRDDADIKAGVLHREQQIKSLRRDIEGLESELQGQQAELTGAHEELEALETRRDQEQAEATERANRLAQRQAQLSARQAHFEQLKERSGQLQREIEETHRHIAEGREGLTEVHARLQQAADTVQTQSRQRDAMLQRRDALRGDLDEKRHRAKADREHAHEIALEVEAVRTQLQSGQENMERMRLRFDQLSRRREELQAMMAQGDEPQQRLTEQLNRLLADRVTAEERLTEARKAMEAIDQDLRRFHEERTAVEQRLQEVRATLEQQRLACQEQKVRRQTVIEQIAETGRTVDELLADMPEAAEEQEWERRLEAVDRKIQRLGPINLAAIDEFSEQSQRKAYLDEQQADLNEAVATLEAAIHRIDKETRERFKATFEHVNKGLQDLFPRLFGGGQAYLEMTGDNLLETGVAVMARPPGKRNSTIHLLSGGEKALTAIALVFSIFELNPAPFCILDEVDAPLDDTNVVRYCRLVEEMSRRIQFIYITHNKISMEMAHQLTGVTMQEPGVSRLVEVDVDEAVELAVAN